MQRILALGACNCSICGSHRCWSGVVTQVETVERVLEHLRLESRAQPPLLAQAPPQLELWWERAWRERRRARMVRRVGAMRV